MPLLLAGCDSDDSPSAPAPVTPATPTPAPTPTPAATSPYAGNWIYRSTLTAVDMNCGHTPADIGRTEAPIAVTVASDGTFALRGGSTGALASGNASLTLAAASETCGAGSGAGGCRDNDHCDGTSVQAGDVRKWTLVRQ